MKQQFERWLQDSWYKEMYISSALMPISMLYDDIRRFRAFLYRKGIFKTTKVSVPVIIVGNITVGGTGKTPLVLYLAHLLKSEGYQVGIISRGYGGEATQAPQWVNKDSDPKLVGDEAVLMAKRADCPVAVSLKRAEAAQLLIDKAHCQIILSDDGLQHYALARDIEIVVIDGERRFGNGYTLPCGPLREPIDKIHQVDLVIVNGIQSDCEDNEFFMTVTGDTVINCVTQEERLLSEFKGLECHALAGIGNPKRFFTLLEQHQLVIESHAFTDHYQFMAHDIIFTDDKPILMTEKDAVKCLSFATEQHWYLPVKAQPQQAFTDKLLQLIERETHG